MTRLSFTRSAALLVAATLPLVFLAGCGSGGNSGGKNLAPGNTTATVLPGPYGSYTGTGSNGGIEVPVATTRYYQSTWALSGGNTATANVTAQPDGSASGTLTIDSGTAAASRAKTRAVIGTGNVTGTVDFSTGAVHLTGSITQDGQTTPIDITGTAPGSGTGGNSSLQLGQTFLTAQWVVSTTGPISSNGNNGGNASGGASSITFSANSSNIASSNLNGAAAVATLQSLPYVGDLLTISAADVVNGTARNVTVVLSGQTLQTGTVVTLQDGDVSSVSYAEGNSTGSNYKAFGSTGGTVTVTAINGKEYTLKLTGVTVTPLTGNPIYKGTGSFTIDGTITATLP